MTLGGTASAGELLTIDVEATGDVGAWTLGLPAARGVVVLEGEDGAAAGVISSADIRRAVRSRLGDDAGGGRRADLRGVVRRVRAARCGSAFENDLVFLEVAREVAAGMHRVAGERWVAWFAHIDPESSAPRWIKASTRELGSGRVGRGRLVGVFADKQSAAKAVEALDYLFDLCRYPKELERSPHGRACAYKGMGLCPAACDGSETIGALQARAAASADVMGGGLDAWRERVAAEMNGAAEGMDFERAELLKRKLDKGKDLESRGMRWAGRGEELAWVVVARSEHTGWARVMVVGGGGWRVVCDAQEDCDANEIARVVERCAGSVSGDPRGGDGRADVVGLMGWWAYRAASDLDIEIERIDGSGVDPGWISRSVTRCVRGNEGRGEADGEDRVIECEPTGRG